MTEVEPPAGKFGSYRDAFKIYEDGKHRHYSLLFAVNGGAAALASLYQKDGLGALGPKALATGVVIFTILMGYDIWIFGQRMREAVGEDTGGANRGIFSRIGKVVLSVCCALLAIGWMMVAYPLI
jgi:hypothetical protein